MIKNVKNREDCPFRQSTYDFETIGVNILKLDMLSKLMIFILVNIALNKPTHQQYPYLTARSNFHPSVVEASNAVDGLKSDLSVRGGQCVISENGKQTATWWVNLTNILSIHHITIYYRTENEEWGTNLMMKNIKIVKQIMTLMQTL